MKAQRFSAFKKPAEAAQFLEDWNQQIETLNGFVYQRLTISTTFGNTRVWVANPHLTQAQTLVFFPGARTCGLFWDMDNALLPFRATCRYYIIDVNGQPSLSDGQYLRVKKQDYGHWATQILDALGLARTVVVGASLGGLICLKLCLVAPERVQKAILLNPAGIQPFSGSVRNLYYNLLPILWPTQATLTKFLDKAIFRAPYHDLPPPYRNLIERYFLYVLRNHQFKGDYPAPLSVDELHELTTPVFLILGENDLLFPAQESLRLAQRHILSLRQSRILAHTGHGIETSQEALRLAFEYVNYPATTESAYS